MITLSPEKKENIRLKILLTMAGCTCFNDPSKLKECPAHKNPDTFRGIENIRKELEDILPEGMLDLREEKKNEK